jgi:hypothetical protein
VFDPLQPQVLTIRKDNTLIGFNLIVSTEWDANPLEIDKIKKVLTDASNRIYYATDGQFFLEHIKIKRNKQDWQIADMWLKWGSGTHTTFRSDTTKVIYMYQFSEDHAPHGGDYAHELLHYFCYLGDENELRGSTHVPLCTRRFLEEKSGDYAYGGKKCSCPMAYVYEKGPYKLCTNLPDNPHNHKTPQGAESCWDILYRLFMETPAVGEAKNRWQLRHPKFRGTIIEGPSKIPVDGWSTVE